MEYQLVQTFSDKMHWVSMLWDSELDVDLPGIVDSVLERLDAMNVDGVLFVL